MRTRLLDYWSGTVLQEHELVLVESCDHGHNAELLLVEVEVAGTFGRDLACMFLQGGDFFFGYGYF